MEIFPSHLKYCRHFLVYSYSIGATIRHNSANKTLKNIFFKIFHSILRNVREDNIEFSEVLKFRMVETCLADDVMTHIALMLFNNNKKISLTGEF